MNRQKLLLFTIGPLGLVWLGIWIHSWWGTITLDYENKPLQVVLQSFTRQPGLPNINVLGRKKPLTILHRY